MAIKISEWVDGNVLEAVDLNDSFGAVARGTAEQANKILKAAGSYENGGVTAADNFTTAAGVNGTVNNFNPNSPYVIVEADSIPAVSINDCESLTLSTGRFLITCTVGTDEEKRAKIYKTLFYGTGTGNNGLAKDIVNCTAIKTNIARDVGKRAYYGFSSVGDFANSSSGNYVRLDGSFASTTGNESVSSWSYCTARNNGVGEWEIATNTVRNSAQSTNSTIVTSDETGFNLTGDEIDNPSTCRFEARAISSAADYGRVYGFILTSQAITFTETETVSGIASFSTGSTDFLTEESIPVFTAAEIIPGTTAIFASGKYISNSTVSNGAIDNSGTFNNSITLNLDGGVKFTMNSTKNLISVDKDASATVTRCLLKDSAGTVITTATFSGNTATFDDIPVLTNATEYRLECDNNGANATYRRNTSPSFPVLGTNLNFTGGSVNGADNTTNYNIASVNTGDVSYIDSTMNCNTNTITLDSNVKAVQVYADSEIPTGTSMTIDISDGTTTLVSGALVDSNGFTDVQDLSSAVAGDLELTINLNTTDTSVTPSVKGYGVNVLR